MSLRFASYEIFKEPKERWDEEKDLHFCGHVPAPIVAALVRNYIFDRGRYYVHSHCQDGPPKVLAAAEEHLVGVPPWGFAVYPTAYEPPC